MKRIKKYLSIYLSIFIVLIMVLKPLNVSAIGGYFTTDSFTFSSNNITVGNYTGGYWYMEDDSNLPDTFNFYWKIEDGKAECCLVSELVTNILNKKIGVTLSTSYLNLLLQNLNSFWKGTGVSNLLSLSEFLDEFHPVFKGNTMVGISLTDLGGCRMVYATPTDSVPVPSNVVNNVYNYYEDYTININPSALDYIQMPCMGKNDAVNSINSKQDNYVSQNTKTNYINFVNSLGSGTYASIQSESITSGFKYNGSGSSGNGLFIVPDNSIIVAKDNTTFNNIVTRYNLNDNKTNVTLLEYTDTYLNSSVGYWNFLFYSNNLTQIQTFNIQQYPSGTTSVTYNPYDISLYGRDNLIPISGKQYLTIYRSSNIPQSIQNNTYQKNYYTSTTTNNFSTSNNNSYTTNQQTVQNSTTTNTNIYNQSQQTTNNNTTTNNYEIDNSTNDNSVTTIINNYYGDDSGGDGDDDDDDDSIWDALLKALGDFLKKIGELLATILTGIISICTSVLDAIASIAESFTGITDFIGSIFAFIPSDIVAVLTLGITLAVLISLIKIFRG